MGCWLVGWLLLGAYVVGWISVVVFFSRFFARIHWRVDVVGICGSNSSSELKAKTQMYMVGYLSCRFNFWISLCLLLIAVCTYIQTKYRAINVPNNISPKTVHFSVYFVIICCSSNFLEFYFSAQFLLR